SRAQRRGGGELALALEELGECAGSAPSPEDAAISSELSELINCFLGSLNERERGIFLRRYFYVETPEQIAERYGLKRGNVSTILSRTRSKLKSFLESEGYNT
ncbi:MAG TPA: sigma-70 family RNA polymerase sigma factor, partial [Candidatus Scatomorpha merdigallinarum]|nr:sigma-70 family RNA polymerase sigma factor [Candidatus Scatomorpha merdigallinarum]